ncbi:altronate hydrolase [Salinadaptatus halalkaliphilus]|uniref:Altronate hydrolase n=1 Tax=Salinadaptatus halalkaliphilus TaxID=2419781 RepID=A0A4V3VL49_9EURY|nr:UxaA family hydrolase [Salinadaptatus halalkaliphilus]THE64247.1 altronate hydrolase [Salinadaptatus halalkaliphilus]
MKGVVIDDKALLMAENDTVATALDDLEAGTELPVDTDARSDDSATGETGGASSRVVVLEEAIEFGHKIALADIEAGEKIYKYGEVIGVATADVPAGAWVHTHNCASTRGRVDREADDATALGAGGDPR